MWKAGQLPVPAEQLPTGTIIVKAAKSPTNAVGLYARVSSSDQKKDLEAQLGGWSVTPRTHRLVVVQAVAEVGSGLNGHRHRLIQLLADPQVEASWSSTATGSCALAPSMWKQPCARRDGN